MTSLDIIITLEVLTWLLVVVVGGGVDVESVEFIVTGSDSLILFTESVDMTLPFFNAEAIAQPHNSKITLFEPFIV